MFLREIIVLIHAFDVALKMKEITPKFYFQLFGRILSAINKAVFLSTIFRKQKQIEEFSTQHLCRFSSIDDNNKNIKKSCWGTKLFILLLVAIFIINYTMIFVLPADSGLKFVTPMEKFEIFIKNGKGRFI